MVMCALRKKWRVPGTLLTLAGIINSFMKNIQTDLTPEQISQLACLGTQMTQGHPIYFVFHANSWMGKDVWSRVVDDVFCGRLSV